MNVPNSLEWVEAFVEKYSLRYVEQDKHFLGLFKGLLIDMWEQEGSVWISFCSPTVRLADAILDRFNGFTNVAGTAIPTDWLQCRYSRGEADTKGCLLELSGARLAEISEVDLLALPEAVALDFEERGASAELPTCSMCNAVRADKLLYANDTYETACNSCFDNLRDYVPGGVVTREDPIQWKPVAKTLIMWSAAFTLIWGLIQQSEKGVEAQFLLAAPFVASIFFCRAVGRAAQGMNLWLRVLTATCILLCIVSGNIWGMHTAILRQQQISWTETVGLYFTWALTHEESNAWWFLLGGLAVVWLGFGMLKGQGVVKYR